MSFFSINEENKKNDIEDNTNEENKSEQILLNSINQEEKDNFDSSIKIKYINTIDLLYSFNVKNNQTNEIKIILENSDENLSWP